VGLNTSSGLRCRVGDMAVCPFLVRGSGQTNVVRGGGGAWGVRTEGYNAKEDWVCS